MANMFIIAIMEEYDRETGFYWRRKYGLCDS